MIDKTVHRHAKLIAYTALYASIIFSVSGQLLMKWAASGMAGDTLSWPWLLKLAIALSVYSLGVLNWIVALRFVTLSVAYPLTSLNYVGILLGAHYFFDEQVTLIRIAGVVLIFIGVLLVVLRAPPTLADAESSKPSVSGTP